MGFVNGAGWGVRDRSIPFSDFTLAQPLSYLIQKISWWPLPIWQRACWSWDGCFKWAHAKKRNLVPKFRRQKLNQWWWRNTSPTKEQKYLGRYYSDRGKWAVHLQLLCQRGTFLFSTGKDLFMNVSWNVKALRLRLSVMLSPEPTLKCFVVWYRVWL